MKGRPRDYLWARSGATLGPWRTGPALVTAGDLTLHLLHERQHVVALGLKEGGSIPNGRSDNDPRGDL